MQHRHLDAERPHEAHVVLDHDDGMRLVDLAQHLRGGLGLDVGHAGHRLVDQHQLGVLRQQHADLQPLFLAVAEARAQHMLLRLHADDRQDLGQPVVLGPGRRRAQQLVPGAHARQRQQEIVAHRVVIEHRGLLELPPDAERGDMRLVELGEVGPPVEHDLALVRPRLAGDDVHHGGLAGAVGADDGAHFAGLDQQRQVVQRLEAVERYGDAAQVEQCRGASWRVHAGRTFFVLSWAHSPTTPLGRNRVTKMNSAPSANSQTSGSAPVR